MRRCLRMMRACTQHELARAFLPVLYRRVKETKIEEERMMTGVVMVVAVLGYVFVAAAAVVCAAAAVCRCIFFIVGVARQGVRQFRGNSCGMAHVPFAVH